jgi:hypothetical protein
MTFHITPLVADQFNALPFVPECEMGHDPPGQHDEYARETL